MSDKSQTWLMFDRIARTYDPLNRVLSMGIDRSWRKKVARYLPPGDSLALLDLATGTGDQLIQLCQMEERIHSAVGMDMSEGMLAIGREKVKRASLRQPAELVAGDATYIPAQDGSFDVVTMSFGIRNVDDVPGALKEIFHVLRPGGRALILEFALPANALVRSVYLLYFRRILPWIGALISGDKQAYSYLNQSVEAFPYGAEFCELMRAAGFVNVKTNPLTFGIAMIYQGDKV